MIEAEVHDEIARRLRLVDQRYTAQRRALIEALGDADQPLTIPQVLDARPGLAQSSAYRNLAVLESAGAVHRVVTADEFARFELAEDLTDHHHHHLVCTGCGEVVDVTVPAALERQIDRGLGRLARKAGFTLEHHRLDLIGRCSACR